MAATRGAYSAGSGGIIKEIADAPEPRTRGALMEVATDARDGDKVAVISVDGALELGDERRFADVAIQAADTAIVALNSPGGSIYTGIEIGKVIRLNADKGRAVSMADGSLVGTAEGLPQPASSSDRSGARRLALRAFVGRLLGR